MNESLQNQLVLIIDQTKDGLAKAVEVLCEQFPLLVREVLWWEGVHSFVYFLFFVVVTVLCFLLYKPLARFGRETIYKGESCVLRVCVALTQITLVFAVFYNLTWLKCMIAPRLFLIEYIQRFV